MRSPKVSNKKGCEIFYKNGGGGGGGGVTQRVGFSKKGGVPDYFTALSTKLM